jgi:uncharacterized membrane protein YfcA
MSSESTASSATTFSSAPATATATADDLIVTDRSAPNTNVDAIVGGVVGGLAALFLLGGAIAAVVILRRRRGTQPQPAVGAQSASVLMGAGGDDGFDSVSE